MNIVYSNNNESLNNYNNNISSSNTNNNILVQSLKTTSLKKYNIHKNNNIETSNSLKNNNINNNLISYKRNSSGLNQVVCNLEPLHSPYKFIKSNNNTKKRYSSNNNSIKFDIGIIPSPSSSTPSTPSISSSSSSLINENSLKNKYSANSITISPLKNSNNNNNDESPSIKYLYNDFRKSSGTFSIENLTIDSDSDNDNDNDNDRDSNNSNINNINNIELNESIQNNILYNNQDYDNLDNENDGEEIDYNIVTPIRKSGTFKSKEIINLELVQKVNENNIPKLQLTSHQSEYIINRIEKEREIRINNEIEKIKEEMEEKFNRIRVQCEKERIEEINQFKFQQNQLYYQLEKDHKTEKKEFINKLIQKKEKFKKEIMESRDIIIRCNRGEEIVRDKLEKQRLEIIKQQELEEERKRKILEEKERKRKEEKERLEKLKKEKEEERKRKEEQDAEIERLKKEKQQKELEQQQKQQQQQQQLLEQQQKQQQLEQQKQQQQLEQQYNNNNNNNNNNFNNNYRYCKDFNNYYYNGYIERKEFINNYTNSLNSIKLQLPKDKLDYERQLVKSINIAINQISASKEQTESKAKKLIDILSNEKRQGSNNDDYFYKVCLLAIANKSMGQVESQITFHLVSAFPLADVLIKVSKQFPELLKILLCKLEEHSIYSVPLYPIKIQGESKESYQLKSGYLISQDTNKAAENEEEFNKRMSGYLALLTSLIIKSEQPTTSTQFGFGFGSLNNTSSSSSSNDTFNLDLAFKWLYAVTSMKPIRITSYLLVTFLTNLGNILSKKQTQLFNQLISKINSNEFISHLSTMTGTEGSLSRLQELIKNNNFIEPEGLNYS